MLVTEFMRALKVRLKRVSFRAQSAQVTNLT